MGTYLLVGLLLMVVLYWRTLLNMIATIVLWPFALFKILKYLSQKEES